MKSVDNLKQYFATSLNLSGLKLSFEWFLSSGIIFILLAQPFINFGTKVPFSFVVGFYLIIFNF